MPSVTDLVSMEKLLAEFGVRVRVVEDLGVEALWLREQGLLLIDQSQGPEALCDLGAEVLTKI